MDKLTGQPKDLQEVKPIREVQPKTWQEHCGARMRKLTSASPITGKMLTVFACERCGAQIKETA